MALTDQQKSDVFSAGGDVLGGLFGIWGKSKDIKAQKYQSQAELIKAIAEQKRSEAEQRTKRYIVGGLISLVVIVGIIITVVILINKQKEKQQSKTA